MWYIGRGFMHTLLSLFVCNWTTMNSRNWIHAATKFLLVSIAPFDGPVVPPVYYKATTSSDLPFHALSTMFSPFSIA